MSRNWLIYSLLVAVFTAPLAHAQQAPANKDELAYRAGLGRADDIKLLLNQGANPNTTNSEGLPLLIVAASRKDGEALGAVQALLEGGANVNVKDGKGQTALYYAARAGKIDVVEHLLKNRIDYYSLDNNGDIARTIAFRGGHKDIVALMDNYVKSQTLTAENTYQNSQLLQKQQMEKASAAARLQNEQMKKQAAALAAKQKAEQQRLLTQYKENMKKLGDKVYDMSYHACAFQYWSFGLAANQTMEISDEEVEETIGMHRKEVQATSIDVMKMFSVGHSYVDKVITPSKQAIFSLLSAMPSRTYRKELGFGTLVDVHKRCDKIAKNWEIAPASAKKPAATAPANQSNDQKALQERLAKQKADAERKKQQNYPGRQMIQKTGPAAMQ